MTHCSGSYGVRDIEGRMHWFDDYADAVEFEQDVLDVRPSWQVGDGGIVINITGGSRMVRRDRGQTRG